MKKRRKNFLITTMEHEITVIRSESRSAVRDFCPQCRAIVEYTSFDLAGQLVSIGARRLVTGIESGAVHSIETTDGLLVICLRSLEREKRNAIK